MASQWLSVALLLLCLLPWPAFSSQAGQRRETRPAMRTCVRGTTTPTTGTTTTTIHILIPILILILIHSGASSCSNGSG